MRKEPIFNVPPVILALLATLALVHLARILLLNETQDIELLLMFAFIPARYDATVLLDGPLPGGFGAQIWSFVSYAFLHADWMHLAVNTIWLLPFGTAVARRFGALRFMLFFAVASAAGALAQYAVSPGAEITMIGASAAISGTMAAAMRFVFQRGGPLGVRRGHGNDAFRIPALPLSGAVRDPRVLGFVAVWFGVNLLFGIGSFSIGGTGQPVAWQAHIGGFLAGMFLFGLFDPVRADATPVQRF